MSQKIILTVNKKKWHEGKINWRKIVESAEKNPTKEPLSLDEIFKLAYKIKKERKSKTEPDVIYFPSIEARNSFYLAIGRRE